MEKLSFVIKFVSVGTSRRCGGSRDQFLVVNSWTKHLLEYPDFELDLMHTLILNHKIYWDLNTDELNLSFPLPFAVRKGKSRLLAHFCIAGFFSLSHAMLVVRFANVVSSVHLGLP